MTLNELKLNESFIIMTTIGDGAIYNRLSDLGLQSFMKLTFVGPKEDSDTMFFYTDYNNCNFSISREKTSDVIIKKV